MEEKNLFERDSFRQKNSRHLQKIYLLFICKEQLKVNQKLALKLAQK